eukprot:COSAG02_NODE_274_length_26244_cov_36.943507_31_plen_171_part_00
MVNRQSEKDDDEQETIEVVVSESRVQILTTEKPRAHAHPWRSTEVGKRPQRGVDKAREGTAKLLGNISPLQTDLQSPQQWLRAMQASATPTAGTTAADLSMDHSTLSTFNLNTHVSAVVNNFAYAETATALAIAALLEYKLRGAGRLAVSIFVAQSGADQPARNGGTCQR